MIIGIFTPFTTYADEISVTIDGVAVVFPDARPQIVDGRTLVPVRAVFEAAGFDVDWDIDTRTATLTRGNDTIIITIGSATFTTNGVSHALDVPAQIIGNSTMLPIRLPLESVGYNVDWSEATQTVLITTPQPPREPIVITESTHRVVLTGASNIGALSPDWPPYVTLGRDLELYYFASTTTRVVSSDTSIMSDVDIRQIPPSFDISGNQLAGLIFARVHRPGTATLTLLDANNASLGQVTVTISPAERTLLRADETGVHIFAPIFLSQEQIQNLVPFARTPQQQLADLMPHPARRMTAAEFAEWNAAYDAAGGINTFELETLYAHNTIRAEHGLTPFSVCPGLFRAARLHSQLMREHSFFGHIDPFYGQPGARAAHFWSAAYNAENIAAGAATPTGATNMWMGSPGHRANILGNHTHIGFGRVGGLTTAKFGW